MDNLFSFLDSPLAKAFSGVGSALVAAIVARLGNKSKRLIDESEMSHFLRRSDSEIGVIEDLDVKALAHKLRQRSRNREKYADTDWVVLVGVAFVLPVIVFAGSLVLVKLLMGVPIGSAAVAFVFVWTLICLFSVSMRLSERETKRRQAAWLYGISLAIDRFAGTNKDETELTAQLKEYARLLHQVSDKAFAVELGLSEESDVEPSSSV